MTQTTIDTRMESFAEASRLIPPEAHRLRDHEARHHGAEWIRRLLGKGIACDYVIGYAHGQSWWTFCFDRKSQDDVADLSTEVWRVEGYDSIGHGWSDTFKYWPDFDRWQFPVVDERPNAIGQQPPLS